MSSRNTVSDTKGIRGHSRRHRDDDEGGFDQFNGSNHFNHSDRSNRSNHLNQSNRSKGKSIRSSRDDGRPYNRDREMEKEKDRYSNQDYRDRDRDRCRRRDNEKNNENDRTSVVAMTMTNLAKHDVNQEFGQRGQRGQSVRGVITSNGEKYSDVMTAYGGFRDREGDGEADESDGNSSCSSEDPFLKWSNRSRANGGRKKKKPDVDNLRQKAGQNCMSHIFILICCKLLLC